MKKLLLILFSIFNLYAKIYNQDYIICNQYISKNYKIICLNGEEFLATHNYIEEGISKTGHKCKCITKKGLFKNKQKIKRIK